MPMPMEYQHASEDFDRFLVDARDALGLATRNQTYTTVQAVFQVFRRRLTIEDGILFAIVLPPVLRALFIAEWDPKEPVRPFESRVALAREVQTLRKDHNFSPDTAIQDVAAVLQHHLDVSAFETVLNRLPPEAKEFWTP